MNQIFEGTLRAAQQEGQPDIGGRGIWRNFWVEREGCSAIIFEVNPGGCRDYLLHMVGKHIQIEGHAPLVSRPDLIEEDYNTVRLANSEPAKPGASGAKLNAVPANG